MSTGVTLLRQAQRAVLACSGLTGVNGHTVGYIVPACTQVLRFTITDSAGYGELRYQREVILQVAAARWPWAAVNAWQSQGVTGWRNYSGKHNSESTPAAEGSGSSQQQETQGSDPSIGDAEQAAAAEQAEMEEGNAALDELQQLLNKAQEDVSTYRGPECGCAVSLNTRVPRWVHTDDA